MKSMAFTQSIMRSPALRILLVVVGILVCIGSIVMAEVMPRFIVLDVPPPNQYEGGLSGAWKRESREILTEPPGAFPDDRVFIWRTETFFLADSAHHIDSWQGIVGYFDNELASRGWFRSTAYAPCGFYLNEAKFLPSNESNGYVNYRRNGYQPYHDLEQSDVVCLAVWKDQSVYHGVILTGRSSLFTLIIHSVIG